ncbi:MAG: DUF2188 domain-containing protein [Chloroflexi bacterium]|nr:DUF2188 domain-containing protein [Chloroflexota bacterium]
MAKIQHVVPRDGRWVVVGEGNQRATRVTDTRGQALRFARRIARNQGSDVVVHGVDGSLWEDHYGGVPPRCRNGKG